MEQTGNRVANNENSKLKWRQARWRRNCYCFTFFKKEVQYEKVNACIGYLFTKDYHLIEDSGKSEFSTSGQSP